MQHLQPNTTLQGGKYRIKRVLGQGGFGITYVGYNTEFEETVAIKEFYLSGINDREGDSTAVSVSNGQNIELFAEQKEKFKKEARRMRQFNNPHIVRVHDLFEEYGTAYYVMGEPGKTFGAYRPTYARIRSLQNSSPDIRCLEDGS